MPAKRPVDPEAFILANLRLEPVPGLPEIMLYTAHSGSGLGRLLAATGSSSAPYWAYPWAGGAALAFYLRDHPEAVAGRRVLDLGAGSGLVAIAAARARAAEVVAAEIDPNGLAALRLNAAANGVRIASTGGDLTLGEAPDVEIILVGDLFYDAATAARVSAFLDRCLVAGIEILVGDPGRAHLPHARLTQVAEYRVSDVGAIRGGTDQPGLVFRFGATTSPAAAGI